MEIIKKDIRSEMNADLHEDELSIINATVDDSAMFVFLILSLKNKTHYGY